MIYRKRFYSFVFFLLLFSCTPKNQPQSGTSGSKESVYTTQCLLVEALGFSVYQSLKLSKAKSGDAISDGMALSRTSYIFSEPLVDGEATANCDSNNLKLIITHYGNIEKIEEFSREEGLSNIDFKLSGLGLYFHPSLAFNRADIEDDTSAAKDHFLNLFDLVSAYRTSEEEEPSSRRSISAIKKNGFQGDFILLEKVEEVEAYEDFRGKKRDDYLAAGEGDDPDPKAMEKLIGLMSIFQPSKLHTVLKKSGDKITFGQAFPATMREDGTSFHDGSSPEDRITELEEFNFTLTP